MPTTQPPAPDTLYVFIAPQRIYVMHRQAAVTFSLKRK